MVLDHGAAESDEPECELTSARNANWGLWLFAIYLTVYAIYVLMNTFASATMNAVFMEGINLATVYGLFLIVLAFVMSMIYGWVCRSPVSTVDNGEERAK